ncbi:hypothetical protein GCM10010357_13460 [Streptomyces luteireticuli]|uniref:2-deoxy-scyllo-inosamine dehydrogenase n=2 Tax=Streptomyces luteireticuli TaxID=173858 RepID=A0ABN1VQI7_9ACTN
MAEMRAILKQGTSVRVKRVPVPEPEAGEVLIRVAVAGVCRSDVNAALGLLPCADPLVLGHEFSGVIAGLAPDVRGFAVEDRVSVMPLIPCMQCDRCADGETECCPYHECLGFRRPGAFAEFVTVPARVVHRMPGALTFREGAYAEPVCSSLGVLKAEIKPPDRGLVHGADRTARLTERVLRSYGFTSLDVRGTRTGEDLAGRIPPDTYDFVVVSEPRGEILDEMIRVVRPGGRIIVRGRPLEPVPIDLDAALRKEVTLESVSYGTFAESLGFLSQETGTISDLLGSVRPLEDFEDVFSAESESQRLKSFFCPNFAAIGTDEIEAWGRLMGPGG